jgi:hypothetical protein
MVRKAQIVSTTENAHRSAFWALYGFIGLFFICQMVVNSSIHVPSLFEGACDVQLNFAVVGMAEVFEGLICVLMMIVFLVPLWKLPSIASNDISQSQSSKSQLRRLIWKKFMAGSFSFFFSWFVHAVYMYSSTRSQRQKFVTCPVMQTDVLVGLAAMMLLTPNLWSPQTVNHHKSLDGKHKLQSAASNSRQDHVSQAVKTIDRKRLRSRKWKCLESCSKMLFTACHLSVSELQ